jgi:flagellar biosynthesis protein FlhF
MNIRRFVASDMREALRQVRALLGADAVMLSSKNIPEGVEVIAAIDYDDTLIGGVVEQVGTGNQYERARDAERIEDTEQLEHSEHADQEEYVRLSSAGTRTGVGRESVSEYARVAAALASGPVVAGDPIIAAPPIETAALNPAAAPIQPAAVVAIPTPPAPQTVPQKESVPLGGDTPSGVAAELNDLRQLLEHQLSSLAWNDMNRREPSFARALRHYATLGLDPTIARQLAAQLRQAPKQQDPRRAALQVLARKLPLAKEDLAEMHGVFALVGPTGVGKTTTIAKIAARFALRHGIDQFGLVTTDAYRIGARDQLMTFARILGTPMRVANSPQQMCDVLDGMRDKRLVLIDTAGMSHRDTRLMQQFEALRVDGHRLRTLLVLSAASDHGHLRRAAEVFRAARPIALIATKVDEATSLGPILSVALESRLTLAYLCNGQRVPEDLLVAANKRAWIIQQAMRLAEEFPRRHGEDRMAAEFGSAGLVANG